ncbi:hypothetical protein [Brevibacterium aurantiacum]|uniref:hypothetical protein n=1 Tax=Brevibacterium aurantiacum TaxID=273384 RepID=UPI001080730B|nr:hypothetical protein [Brevibacterium aurantiacum]
MPELGASAAQRFARRAPRPPLTSPAGRTLRQSEPRQPDLSAKRVVASCEELLSIIAAVEKLVALDDFFDRGDDRVAPTPHRRSRRTEHSASIATHRPRIVDRGASPAH